MKFNLKDIKRMLKDDPSTSMISDRLFQLGHEHTIANDIVDIEFTPNRGDCLSIKGISRDLSIFFGLGKSESIFEDNINNLNLDFKNNFKELCTDISFLKIKVRNFSTIYNNYIEDYFTSLDIKKNNFFTDISNYLSYEQGQPTHCYDFNSIRGKITLEPLEENSEFTTLTDKKIKLKAGDPVFLSNNEIINLAGIIGGKNTACNEETKTVLVECAYFNPELIIGKSTRYDVNSDAAYKFEREVDCSNQEMVLRRFINIVQEHAEIESIELFQKSYSDKEENVIEIDTQKINKILGISITKDLLEDTLTKLGFTVKNDLVSVPSFRHDITNINDLAEEVARVIGYNKIDPEDFTITKNTSNNKNNAKNNIKSLLIKNGFYEVINSPFTENILKADKNINYDPIRVDNPLDSTKKYLRTSLIPSLIENLLYNERAQKDSIKFFEISDIYFTDPKGNIKRKEMLGVIGSGRVGNNHIEFSKKITESYFLEIFHQIVDKKPLSFTPISRKELDTKINTSIIALEIEISEILEFFKADKYTNFWPSSFKKYNEISLYPSSSRDISFLIEETSAISILDNYILNLNMNILKDVFMFDFFNNDKENTTKIGFRFIFQDNNKTLTEKEVNSALKTIIDKSLSIDGVSIPGL